jgi:arylformamidase
MAKEYQYFDLTLPLNTEIPLPPAIPLKPGDPPPPENKIPNPRVYRFFDVDKGDKVTMSRIEMSSHDGTHIDSPRHFVPGGPTIDTMDLNTTIGPCRVIEIKDEKSVTVAELEPYKIKAGERILFKTKNSPIVWSKRQWDGKFVTLSLEAAKYLAAKKIRLVGFDYISLASAEPPENIGWVHEAFLKAGIFILEAINLDGIKPGNYELICLPLRLDKGDAGPSRVVLRK